MARGKMEKRGVNRTARRVDRWGRVAPRRVREMLMVYRRCGRGAFLDFNANDPAASGYPIVAVTAGKSSVSCRPDCRGLLAAYARARQQHRQKIANKAVGRAVKAGCVWAKDRSGKRRRR
jgi:hypothetical protein